MAQARQRGVSLLLPSDVVVTTSLEGGTVRTCAASEVGIDESIADVGPATVKSFQAELRRAGTVLWNGPMGVFEHPQFAAGTMALARTLSEIDAITVVGGGESVQAVEEAGVADRLTHVSTGGGASLEFIEGKTLPGVAALKADCD
jgi:phosphoglycerate kinase